jgi:threonyl-tRNA synthetase
MTVSEKSLVHGRTVHAALLAAGVKATLDDGDEKIGKKIRECHGQKLPYMAIVGEKEQESGGVSPRSRDEGDLGAMPLQEFVDRVVQESQRPF